MASEPSDIDRADTDTGGSLPGVALKARRESGGHSLDDVSRDTRITRSRLTALENDNYEKVGSHPFVVGYIRKYAKWLGMDGDELVRAYERQVGKESEDSLQAPEADAQAAPSAPAAPTPERSKKFPWLLVLVLIVVLWVLAALLLSGGEEQPAPPVAPATSNPVEPAEADDSSSGQVAPQEFVPQTDSGDTGAEDVAEPVEPEATVVPDQRLEAAAEPGETAGSNGSSVATAGIDTGAEAPVGPTPGTDSLTMAFTDSCWVEVRDRDGNLLLAQLQEAGDDLRLRGAAPFEVMLGDARAVELQVNGRAVDTEPSSSRNTLRVTVGP